MALIPNGGKLRYKECGQLRALVMPREGNAIHGAILPLLMPRDRLYGPNVARYKRHAVQSMITFMLNLVNVFPPNNFMKYCCVET